MAPTEIENIVVNIFGTKATLVMTNVPGPRKPLYFAGGLITGLMFWVPQSGRLGLGVSIFSYNNQVWLGVGTDAELAPDPDAILEGFRQELDALLALARQVDAAAETGDDLTQIRGIGPSFAGKLKAGGIVSFAALAGSSPEALAAIVAAPDWRRPDYPAWIEQARQLDLAA